MSDAYDAYLARVHSKPRPLPPHLVDPTYLARLIGALVICEALFGGLAYYAHSHGAQLANQAAVLYAAYAVPVLAPLVLFLNSVLPRMRRRALARNGEVVEGEIVGINSRTGTDQDLVPAIVYRYEVDGKRDGALRNKKLLDELGKDPVGKRVWVCYDPRKPKRSLIYGPARDPGA